MSGPPAIVPVEGGITAAPGFRAGAVHCGLKSEALDLALIVSEAPASAAGVFTTNRTVAPPVVVCREHLESSAGVARAIAVNSGCANACTGPAGFEAARAMAAATAAAADCPLEQALIASTGVIGLPLSIERVTRGITAAAERLARNGGRAAAEAIMTTDTHPKERAVRVSTPRGTFVVGGMAKGAGMIEPMLATMLAFMTTDAQVDPAHLRGALAGVTEDTFNAITVDGECSTNDAVLLLANGASGVVIDDDLYPAFAAGLQHVARHLARAVVGDGEGATKLVTVRVTGAATPADAQRAAHALANSPLVKTALHGGDPNWGRLVAVAGRAGVAFVFERARVSIGPVVLFADEIPYPEREARAADHLRGREVEVAVDLGTGGTADACVWTCDFSADYVRINADYRT